jgi:hypothetical protein
VVQMPTTKPEKFYESSIIVKSTSDLTATLSLGQKTTLQASSPTQRLDDFPGQHRLSRAPNGSILNHTTDAILGIWDK